MKKTAKKIPIGVSDFKAIRENQYYYIDKTDMIREITDSGAAVLLLPRPRRFGKTLNISMLRYFFEKSEEDRAGLFEGTEIYGTETFREHFGRYPVIQLTFKDIKSPSWKHCYAKLTGLISGLFKYHKSILAEKITDENDLAYIQRMLKRTGERHEYEDALKHLSEFLYLCYGREALILIDEYDAPVHTAWAKGYYEDIIDFLRGFLGGGLKDNSFLFKGVLTGILKIAKESVFSDLNNLDVYTVLDRGFCRFFGFTDEEVKKLLADNGLAESYDAVSGWYDGYRFGGEVIYNPWSVLKYVHRRPGRPRTYWNNTAATEMIDRLVTRGGKELKEEIGLMLEGTAVEKPVYESIVMKDLDVRDDLLWSFLLFSGYLKPTERINHRKWKLGVPNREVRFIYQEMIYRWFSEKMQTRRLEEMLTGLTGGDVVLFERLLRKTVLEIMSYHDLAGEPEKVYHALVLGMMVWLGDEYDIRSNRESGYGRYDLMLKPKEAGKQGIIIEFKLVEEDVGEKPETTLKNALKQIEKRRYAAELEAAGVKDILKLAVAFRGKELWVKREEGDGSAETD